MRGAGAYQAPCPLGNEKGGPLYALYGLLNQLATYAWLTRTLEVDNNRTEQEIRTYMSSDPSWRLPIWPRLDYIITH